MDVNLTLTLRYFDLSLLFSVNLKLTQHYLPTLLLGPTCYRTALLVTTAGCSNVKFSFCWKSFEKKLRRKNPVHSTYMPDFSPMPVTRSDNNMISVLSVELPSSNCNVFSNWKIIHGSEVMTNMPLAAEVPVNELMSSTRGLDGLMWLPPLRHGFLACFLLIDTFTLIRLTVIIITGIAYITTITTKQYKIFGVNRYVIGTLFDACLMLMYRRAMLTESSHITTIVTAFRVNLPNVSGYNIRATIKQCLSKVYIKCDSVELQKRAKNRTSSKTDAVLELSQVLWETQTHIVGPDMDTRRTSEKQELRRNGDQWIVWFSLRHRFTHIQMLKMTLLHIDTPMMALRKADSSELIEFISILFTVFQESAFESFTLCTQNNIWFFFQTLMVLFGVSWVIVSFWHLFENFARTNVFL